MGHWLLIGTLQEKQKVSVLVTCSYIYFTIKLIVIEWEYSTNNETILNKTMYVFQDYTSGNSIYHYTNLLVHTSMKLKTLPRKNSTILWYIMAYFRHKNLMDFISMKSYPNGPFEWPYGSIQECGMFVIFCCILQYVFYLIF